MSTTSTPAERVQRFRAEYLGRAWTPFDVGEADLAARHATTENALDALESGDAAEAAVWTNLGLIASYKYRSATR